MFGSTLSSFGAYPSGSIRMLMISFSESVGRHAETVSNAKDISKHPTGPSSFSHVDRVISHVTIYIIDPLRRTNNRSTTSTEPPAMAGDGQTLIASRVECLHVEPWRLQMDPARAHHLTHGSCFMKTRIDPSNSK